MSVTHDDRTTIQRCVKRVGPGELCNELYRVHWSTGSHPIPTAEPHECRRVGEALSPEAAEVRAAEQASRERLAVELDELATAARVLGERRAAERGDVVTVVAPRLFEPPIDLGKTETELNGWGEEPTSCPPSPQPTQGRLAFALEPMRAGRGKRVRR